MAAVILGGDIGGTKTHLGLFRFDGIKSALFSDRLYHTSQFPSLEAACADFLASRHDKIEAACFGVPGPVVGGEARPTNVKWKLSEASLSAALGGIPVRLINDLAAIAMGAVRLEAADLVVLQHGSYPLHEGNIAVVAAGTGLGEASLAYEAGKYHPVASEGGHSDFAPHTDEQVELLKFLRRKYGHVSCERVLAGPGLVNVYQFLRESSGKREPEWLSNEMRTEDPGAAISIAALHKRDEICVRALEMFVEIYGAEAGNMALKVLATGGVYIAGGIAPKILPALTDGRFIGAFNDKGRLRDMLSQIEVRIAINESTGMLGAGYCAASML